MTDSEIKGSRRTWARGNRYFAEKLVVSDDGVAGEARGTTFTGDSLTTARKRDGITIDPDTVPGVWIIKYTYWNYLPYA